jgi:hypothetical protein
MSTQNNGFFSRDAIPAVCTNEWCVMFSILVVSLALIFACIEIEIEGPCGWADKLPTTNISKNKRSLTVYHCMIFILMFLVFCSIFFINPRNFNIGNLAFCFAYTLLFFTFEDYYWFALNPAYTADGVNVKSGKNAWWHYKIGKCPVLYIAGPLLSLGICMLAGYTKTFVKSSIVMIIFSIFVLLLSPCYQHFYRNTHPDIDKVSCSKQ